MTQAGLPRFGAIAAIATILAASGCAVVDSSMHLRIERINAGYDTAINNEILTNIVRASRFQGLRFYQHNKIVPSQTGDLKLGLPTITLGPVSGARTYAFSGSVADNSASLSLELDPIETRDFHNSLLTPISVGTIGILLQNFPKELVYLALFDSIRVQYFSEDGKTPVGVPIEYRNEPIAATAECPDDDYSAIYEDSESLVTIGRKNVYFPAVSADAKANARCKYQRFFYWTQAAIAYGLSVNFQAVKNPKYVETDPKTTQPKTIVVGKFCFDPAQAVPGRAQLIKQTNNLCDAGGASDEAAPGPVDEGTKLRGFPFAREGGKTIYLAFELRPRSLMGVFTYLGRLVNAPNRGEGLVPLYSPDAKANGDREMLTVVEGASDTCFAAGGVDSTQYCVPGQSAHNTRRLFALLAELIALNSTATDTPTSLTVRVTP